MAKRTKAAPPPSVVPRQAAGRQPRPDIVHSSLYLPESVYEALREIAFRERCKIHDVVLEGIGLALKKRGHSTGKKRWLADIAAAVRLIDFCPAHLIRFGDLDVGGGETFQRGAEGNGQWTGSKGPERQRRFQRNLFRRALIRLQLKGFSWKCHDQHHENRSQFGHGMGAWGRIYEDRHTPPQLRWFWSTTVYVDPALGVTTNGRVPTLEQAKARFRASWSRVSEAREQKERQQP
jgi:hypothetical protein